MLDVARLTPELADAWRANVSALRAQLDWTESVLVVREHRSGASLFAAAAQDQLLTATEVNELAWLRLVAEPGDWRVPLSPGHPNPFDAESALRTLLLLAKEESKPAAMRLQSDAKDHQVAVVWDDEDISLGMGEGSAIWRLDSLPDEVPWPSLCDVPSALVTGSNGKTTTVRLVSAMLIASGRAAGFNCTDGIFVGGERVERGDYSGPAGARRVLRDARVRAAVLETARGGILRRGLAVRRVDAAIVTNISPDHFGEYGIHDLSDLAEAKLVVARALDSDGTLVLNADDVLLLSKAKKIDARIAWFALDDANPKLLAHRAAGGETCGIENGRLRLHVDGRTHDMGEVRAMPLSLEGAATYNLHNLAGAALLASRLGVAPDVIAAVCNRFGSGRGDNPGRMERWDIGGVRVLVDYAHNPEGLDGLLRVADSLRQSSGGRLGLLLGQAGNRDDDAIRELARIAASWKPARVVLKDIEGYMRGRQPGEVPLILRDELLASGLPEGTLQLVLPEIEAAQALIAWANPGDVLALPVHSFAARDALATWLDSRTNP
ncbi:Mur ligase family protein [Arenimonas sp.]|uniref:Mur ligase family protein n=1 Tax=Arenimonas sp. TaxID=1872635 RepID=UPI0039E2913E